MWWQRSCSPAAGGGSGSDGAAGCGSGNDGAGGSNAGAVGGTQVQGQQGTGAANASLLRVMSQWWMWMNLLERGRKGAHQICGSIIPRSSR